MAECALLLIDANKLSPDTTEEQISHLVNLLI